MTNNHNDKINKSVSEGKNTTILNTIEKEIIPIRSGTNVI